MKIPIGTIGEPPTGAYLLGVQNRLQKRLELDNRQEFLSAQVVGTPGFGKSWFLAHLIEWFQKAGEGVILFDIKGDLAELVVRRAPDPRKVIYIDPYSAALRGHYWALNPIDLTRRRWADFSKRANSLTEIMENIGAYDPDVMARIHTILAESMRLAIAQPSATFMDTYVIVHDKDYRDTLLRSPHVPDPTRDYWVNIFPSTLRSAEGMVETTDRRLREILAPPYLLNMLNQPKSTLKLTRWLERGDLIVVNLDIVNLGLTEAQKIGNLLLGYLAQEAIGRPKGQRERIWRVIVDEFHELSTLPFARMIEQMRAANVFPVLAHQFEAQMHPRMLRAAEQCAVRVELRLSESDAAARARLGRRESAQELIELERYTARVTFNEGERGRKRSEIVKLPKLEGTEQPERLERALRKQLLMSQHHSQMDSLEVYKRFQKLHPQQPRATKEGNDEPATINQQPGDTNDEDAPESLDAGPGSQDQALGQDRAGDGDPDAPRPTSRPRKRPDSKGVV